MKDTDLEQIGHSVAETAMDIFDDCGIKGEFCLNLSAGNGALAFGKRNRLIFSPDTGWRFGDCTDEVRDRWRDCCTMLPSERPSIEEQIAGRLDRKGGDCRD
jgi:hypothetical protein